MVGRVIQGKTAKDQTAVKSSQSGYTCSRGRGVCDVLSANGSPSHAPRGGSGGGGDVLVVAAAGADPRDSVGMIVVQGVYVVVQTVRVGPC